jgi:hypothetical protein
MGLANVKRLDRALLHCSPHCIQRNGFSISGKKSHWISSSGRSTNIACHLNLIIFPIKPRKNMRYLLAWILAVASMHASAEMATAESIERLFVLTRTESLIDDSYVDMEHFFVKNIKLDLSGQPLNTK